MRRSFWKEIFRWQQLENLQACCRWWIIRLRLITRNVNHPIFPTVSTGNHWCSSRTGIVLIVVGVVVLAVVWRGRGLSLYHMLVGGGGYSLLEKHQVGGNELLCTATTVSDCSSIGADQGHQLKNGQLLFNMSFCYLKVQFKITSQTIRKF